MTHFLVHGPLDVHPDNTMSLAEFESLFKQHCSHHELRKKGLTKEMYAASFQNEDITFFYPGDSNKGKWLKGVCAQPSAVQP